MPNYISPLDDTYIRFDAAAELLSRRNGMSTPDGMLEMLTIAMWRGAFNPARRSDKLHYKADEWEDMENWLSIPIQQPRVLLSEGQKALRPMPFEYYLAGRDTVISVMYCSDLLPGDPQGWHDMLEDGDGLHYLHDKDNALVALTQLPLHCYSDAGKAYLCSIYIPRRLLQTWLDRRSSDFRGMFLKSDGPTEVNSAQSANDAEVHLRAGKRGRPSLAAWDMIEIWAVKIDAHNPDMQRKQLAGRLYTMALEHFDKSAVPSESTIVRKLGEFLDDPRPPMNGVA